MVNCSRQYLFIFLFSLANFFRFISSDGIKLDLITQHDSGRNWRGGIHRLTQLASRDAVRRQARERHVYRPACATGVSGEMPINAGADFGAGQYLVHFRVGSPPQSFALIADTGSDLTWVNCQYRCLRGQCRRRGLRRVFRADRSSSFRTLPCSSGQCKVDLAGLFSLSRCPSPMSPCAYDYRYSDGSAAIGLFANETITFGLTNRQQAHLDGVLVGCSQSTRGQSFDAADGVMGLGYSNFSLAVKATQRFGGKFSYCLVDHLSPNNVSSYLIFGSQSHKGIVHRMRYTALVLGVIPPFYGVNLRGISMGGSMLDIPAETWNLNGVGGVILDSGSSLTALTRPAYQPVMSALRQSVQQLRKLDLDIGPLEYCFNSTGFRESVVPRLVFHFADGARLEPPVKSYVIDAAAGVKCLGFVAATWPGSSVIGNIMQQNHFWEFDVVNGRLGFARSSCT